MKIKSLLPQDTRVAEIYGALGLVFLGVGCAVGTVSHLTVTSGQPIQFWALLFTVLGLLQVSAVALYPSAEVLRIIMSWVNGSCWVWVTLSAGYVVGPSDISGFMLGIANLYAFVINANMLRRSWT